MVSLRVQVRSLIWYRLHFEFVLGVQVKGFLHDLTVREDALRHLIGRLLVAIVMFCDMQGLEKLTVYFVTTERSLAFDSSDDEDRRGSLINLGF